MDRESQPKKHNDATRRHRRSALHFPTSTGGRDFGRDISEKLQELARINTMPGSDNAELSSEYVLPGIPSAARRRPPTMYDLGHTGSTRVETHNQSRPMVLHGHSSLEDLRTRNPSKAYSKSARENGFSGSHFATLPRRGRHSRGETMGASEFFRSPGGSSKNTMSFSSTTEASKDESTQTEPASRSASDYPVTKHTSAKYDAEPRESPSRSVYGRRMLRLMSATRGRMKGRLLFRTEPAQTWSAAPCWIDQETGSLLCEATAENNDSEQIVKDLRGCRVQTLLDPEYSSAVLVLRPKDSAAVIQLRPEDNAQADTWFAALLCWQPLQPAQKLSDSTSTGELIPSAPPVIDPEFKDQSHIRKSPAIIKVGKAFFLESREAHLQIEPFSPFESADKSSETDTRTSPLWSRVSCTLRDNGELKIYTTTDVTTLATIRLANLTRSAIQRVHSSVSGLDFCLAIYPQSPHSAESHLRSRPIFLSFDSRVLFEVWFVLFRTFTSPEIQRFGPPPTSRSRRYSVLLPGVAQEVEPCLFRVERSLQIHVAEARIKGTTIDSSVNHISGSPSRGDTSQARSPQYYTRVFLDGQLKAKTSVKPSSPYLFWYESFNIIDVSPQASNIVVQVRSRSISAAPGAPRLHRSARGILSVRRSETTHEEHEIDAVLGEVTIDINKLHPGVEMERWWNFVDEDGNASGDVLLKIRPEREVILMDSEYAEMSSMLHQEACHFTTRIAEKISTELPRLAECLLNIYQASGQASDWLMALAEEEIDGMRKEIPSQRTRSEARIDSSDSRDSLGGSPGQSDTRASIVRELNNSALAEANLLFRGNTLLSKALDLHMKRLGKDYLGGAIGAKMRAIADQDPECEVDPNRVKNSMDIQDNWQRLLSLTREVWSLIYNSSARCPPELRIIFRHIRACTDDRYGERLPNVRYSSVSGFLFLRFFCPAVLNPGLFGLLNENPRPRAQRTFTLIAKSLQGLANQALFGVKEPWMGAMNQFLDGCRQQFKDFIDAICSLTRDQETSSISPSYSTPLAMFTRLPQLSREGLPSLPYLIDHTRHFATLVNLWVENFPSRGASSIVAVDALGPDLRHFHDLCVRLRTRTQGCLTQAEHDEKRRSTVSEKWQAIAEQIELKPGEFWVDGTRSPIQRARPTMDVNIPTSGRITPCTPMTLPDVVWPDGETPGSASGLASGPPSSVQLSSPASSDMEQSTYSPSSKGVKEAKEKENSMLNLFARRIRR